jgi:hypothetical protein
MKRFVIGFLVGVGLMYIYLHQGDAVETGVNRWFRSSARHYRGDAEHKAAQEALGEGEHRR